MIDRSDPQWYRDAIIYQIHVKSFFDSNNDGIGDFNGVIQSLDYVRDLGATAIWLMPFYPSPLRDDGYDISDYRGINPSYGVMDDFRRLIEAAHERGLRVITELVINHTSDQHPWFQAARQAAPGSPERDFYVWSDTDQKYTATRIIFLDTEASNWTWDPVAKAYFWHRFYSHQPDLNFDNPAVLEAVIDVMRYWLDMGVDGLRLDAIPYLVEREGTNCENLPETHAVIKAIRAALDASYPDRMLLAEANQWPEETAPYFGDGDECHLSFHFPLMPRMYMALAQEDRHPVTDIMRQTPDIPEGCQWAIFLRNHDELTLEMVTASERDYLWSFYAAERRARINLGIRRRLAPLLENDRRKTELLNSLLLSMPGTPVLYYGDEIGMGDNIYLGDRDGVRTPMQWSPDRNGGFSRADPARLYLPAIQDAIYGFNSVNVEAQLASPASLLNWTRRMLAVRRQHPAFGRGVLRFLYPANRRVLAYVREFGDEHILCVANVSRAPQAVELDLAEFNGAMLVELTSGSVFPKVGELPYLLTLPAYGFFWFKLETVADTKDRFGPVPNMELFTLVLTGSAESVVTGRERLAFERTVVPGFLPARRWFAGKATGIRSVTVEAVTTLPDPAGEFGFILPTIGVTLRNGERERYFVPLAIEEGRESASVLAYAVARVRRGPRIGLLFDADATPSFGAAFINALRAGGQQPMGDGGLMRYSPSAQLAADPEVTPAEVSRLGAEQSNTSLVVAERYVCKIARRLQSGVNPEVEVGRFLTEVAHFPQTPQWLGTIEHIDSSGAVATLGVLQRFVRNQGDAWMWTLNALTRGLDTLAMRPNAVEDIPSADFEDAFADYMPYVATLGRRTAELHVALATPSDDPAFGSEPLSADDLAAVAADARGYAERAVASLRRRGAAPDSPVATFLARQPDLLAWIDDLSRVAPHSLKTRVHGDYHLGQVLIVQNDVLIVDFEGEPARPVEERRTKSSPLRDVAGMLRSFAYAAETAARDVASRLGDHAGMAAPLAMRWRRRVEAAFLTAYDAAASKTPIAVADRDEHARLLQLHLVAKALYEIVYEANNRPDWIDIPVRGVLDVMDAAKDRA